MWQQEAAAAAASVAVAGSDSGSGGGGKRQQRQRRRGAHRFVNHCHAVQRAQRPRNALPQFREHHAAPTELCPACSALRRVPASWSWEVDGAQSARGLLPALGAPRRKSLVRGWRSTTLSPAIYACGRGSQNITQQDGEEDDNSLAAPPRHGVPQREAAQHAVPPLKACHAVLACRSQKQQT